MRAFYKSLQENSLSIVFFSLLILSLVLQSRTWAYNETHALDGRSALSIAAYAASANFWFRTLQTWEAEFGVIGIFVILSIFLRQEGSAESKPVEAGDQETGETNK